MSDRDELARGNAGRDELEADLRANPPYHCIDCLVDPAEEDQIEVQGLWVAGWRKKPDEAAIRAIIVAVRGGFYTDSYRATADILALMDGPTDTGEK